MMLPKTRRLRKTSDFERVFKKGKSIRFNGIALKIQPTQNSASRFAVVVSKKVSLKAVVRNKIRRLISEAIGQELKTIPSGFDAVFVVLPEFKAKNLEQVLFMLTPFFRAMRAPKAI